MENKQNLIKRKESVEIDVEDIFKLIKETWPQLKNIKIHKALKQILKFGLLQSASKDDLKELKIIAKLLIEHENISEANEVLELAIENDEADAALIIVNHCSIDLGSKLPKSHMTPIELSLRKGYLLLTQNGSHYDTINSNGLTLLQQAILVKNIELIEILINRGASVHKKGNDESPIILALENGLVDVTELLIKNGADPNSESNNKKTPLHIASLLGLTEIAKILLKAGARTDTKDFLGHYPIHYAACENNVEVLEMLLENGANVDERVVPILRYSSRDFLRWTPLTFAAYKGTIDVAKTLIKYGANIDAFVTGRRTQFQNLFVFAFPRWETQ